MGYLHVNSSQYIQVLGHSQFTLTPTGHNPECFRFWESIHMGSIPVRVLEEEYPTHRCQNSLVSRLGVNQCPTPGSTIANSVLELLQQHAPFIILQQWNELEFTLERMRRVDIDRVSTNSPTCRFLRLPTISLL